MYRYSARAANANGPVSTAAARCEYSYMDVKEASEYTERYRAESMMLIWKLKDRRKRALRNPVLSFLQKKEMAFMESQTRQSIQLYKDAKTLYHRLYDAYLEQLSSPRTYFYKDVA